MIRISPILLCFPAPLRPGTFRSAAVRSSIEGCSHVDPGSWLIGRQEGLIQIVLWPTIKVCQSRRPPVGDRQATSGTRSIDYNQYMPPIRICQLVLWASPRYLNPAAELRVLREKLKTAVTRKTPKSNQSPKGHPQAPTSSPTFSPTGAQVHRHGSLPLVDTGTVRTNSRRKKHVLASFPENQPGCQVPGQGRFLT